ncbi:MAG: PAS domain S-box protein [Spirochaetales bacterium]|nr:PAS domain S-box protein [Spirochaetales bacterium]
MTPQSTETNNDLPRLIIKIILITVFAIMLFMIIFTAITLYMTLNILEPLNDSMNILRYETSTMFFDIDKNQNNDPAIIKIIFESHNYTSKKSIRQITHILSDTFMGFTLHSSLITDIETLLDDIKKIDQKITSFMEEMGNTKQVPEMGKAMELAIMKFREKISNITTELEKHIIGGLSLLAVSQIVLFLLALSGAITIIIFYNIFERDRTNLVRNLALKNNELIQTCGKLSASDQQQRALNQQLRAHEQQLSAINQQLRANEQQLRAANQQLKANEEALRANENRLRMLFDNSSNAIMILEARDHREQYIIRDINPACEAIEKIRREEAINRDLLEILPGIKSTNLLEVFNKVKDSGIPEQVPAFYYRDERISGFREHYVYKIQTGELVCVYNDITEKKQYEKELLLFNDLIDRSNDIIFAIDPDSGNIIKCNKTGSKMLNYEDPELTGNPFTSLLYSHNMLYWPEFREKLIRKGSLLFESIFMKKNGTNVPVEISARYVMENENAYVILIARDISERKKMEGILRLYQKSVEHAEDIIMAVDFKYEFIFVNSIFEKYFTVTRDNLQSKKVSLVLGEQEFEGVFKADFDQCFKGNRIQYEKEFSFPGYGSRFMQLSYYPINTDESKYTVAVLMMKDITERKKNEEERQKIQKLESIGILAGGIAHDFNNLLQSIFGYISMARQEVLSHPDAVEYLDDAISAFNKAKSLTQQLLTFSKGGIPIKTSFQINTLLGETVKLGLSGSNIVSRMSLDGDLWNVEVDEGQIHQVLSNIIINARQSMPTGGNLHVKSSNCIVSSKDIPELKDGRYVEITIRDEGTGIPREYLGKIFDPFFTTKQRGSGLGLATAYSIINKHGGHIKVESALGKGSQFIIYLPATDKPKKEIKTADTASKIGSGTILIMDDEEMILDVTQKSLFKYGYNILSARSGDEAVQICRKEYGKNKKIKMAILDLTIPGGMGGIEAVKLLKQIDPGIVAIVSSGYSDDPVFLDPKQFGFDDMIPKPYHINQLINLVRKWDA